MDTRRSGQSGMYPIRLSIGKGKQTAYIGTSISLFKDEWNQIKGICINHPHKTIINHRLKQIRLDAEYIDLKLQIESGYNNLTASDIKDRIISKVGNESEKRGDFEDYFLKVAESKSESTKAIYMHTLSRIRKYLKGDICKLSFSDITPAWLRDFDGYLSQTAPSANARGIHLRNIRAVFNCAITDELITDYPFRRFKIRTQKTRHRNLSVDRLRDLFSYPCEDYQRRHINIFKLSFLLIGMNMADMARMTCIEDGRINYIRCKTHRPYSIKVEPEALDIINQYRGQKYLLDILDRYSRHQDYTKRVNRSLQAVGELTRSGLGGKKDIKSAFPDLTMYWARHTWATIASDLDIPKDVIASALGHGEEDVTGIYINYNMKKVDRANRLVIDYVLYNKKVFWWSPN